MAWLSDWTYRIEIIIDDTNVDSNLTNFPVMLNLSAASGQGDVDVSCIFDELAQDANRKKIAVTTSDGETQCYVEIELWDDANEVAVLWVKVPSILATGGATLYLYYDSEKADNTDYVGDTGDTPAKTVWDSDFLGVWHMAQEPLASPQGAWVKDSTSNEYHGTPYGTDANDLVAGKIGKAIEFDTSNDIIKVGDITEIDGLSTLTWEAIAKSTTGSNDLVVVGRWFYGDQFRLWMDAGNDVWQALAYDGSNYFYVQPGLIAPDDSLQYLVAVLNGTSLNLYVNNEDGGSNTNGSFTTLNAVASDVCIGADTNSTHHFGDIIDEVRISKIARPAEWRKATFYSHWDDFVAFSEPASTLFSEIIEAVETDDSVEPNFFVEDFTEEVELSAALTPDLLVINFVEAVELNDATDPDFFVVIFIEAAGLNFSIDPELLAIDDLIETAGLSDTISSTSLSHMYLAENIELGDETDPDFFVILFIEAIGLNDNVYSPCEFNMGLVENTELNDTIDPDFFVILFAEGIELNDIIDPECIYPVTFTGDIGLSDEITSYNWTQWLIQNEYRAVKRYYLTLTGTEDSTTDVLLPMKSFQCRLRNGEPTYLSCVVPGTVYAAQINDRPNGKLQVEMAFLISGVEQYKELLAEVDLETIRVDVGGKKQAITLTGHKTESFTPKTVILEGASYYSLSGGKYHYRMPKVDMYLKPGDTVEVNDDSFTVDMVSYSISVNRQQMDVTE